jgi:hypothetical protein
MPLKISAKEKNFLMIMDLASMKIIEITHAGAVQKIVAVTL